MTRLKKVTHTRKPIQFELNTLVSRMNHWSRFLRIVLAALIAGLWVGFGITVLSLVLPSDTFQNPDSALNVVIGLTVLGVLLFSLGWALMVGFDFNPDLPWQASRASAYFVLAGGLVIGLLILAVIFGILYAYVF
ncbi:MAG: hypothetical protein K8I82_02300 [Anaerolineae bacterium]|nr:hypothetical protein [Anaerolineae bacterium]